METPVVSVYCLAYNHEKYIARALESMVNQKTSFPYEIFVHDDASTDGTAAIIRQYAEKYPDLIRPIYQTENQYSKKVGIFKTFIRPLCRGRYIAICEGDDYWCDENKLELQVQVMEREPECQMCCHGHNMVSVDEKVISVVRTMKHDGFLDADKIIATEQTAHTSTYLYRASIWDTYPDFFRQVGVGDFPLRIFCAISGGIYYLDRVMSCYRRFVSGSWSEQMRKAPDAYRAHQERVVRFLNQLDEYTGGKYSETIAKRYAYYEYYPVMKDGSFWKAIRMDHFRSLSLKGKLRSILLVRFPEAKALAVKLLGK